MQSVSADWKLNQLESLRSEGYLRISYEAVDNEAQQDATVSANSAEYYAGSNEIVGGAGITALKYATCEGVWVLDGGFDILPDDAPYGSIGFVSDTLADENGDFTTAPLITLTFSSLQTQAITGITLLFGSAYDEYAVDFNVRVYNGSTLTDSISVSANDQVNYIVEQDISNYDKITIEILTWSFPGHRARLDAVMLGVNQVFNKEDIVSYQHRIECDPISTGLPVNEITFELDNTDGNWNPQNPVGAAIYLIQRQEVKAEYGYKIGTEIEWIKGGTFWLSDWVTPQNGITATFTARHLFDFMSDKYAGTLNDTLYNIAAAALTQADLPTCADGTSRWALDDVLKDISVNITDDYDYTIAETLQLIANAACCVLYQDRDGIINIEPPEIVPSEYPIDKNNSYTYSEYTISKPLKGIVINDGLWQGTAGTTGEIQSVKNPFIQAALPAGAVGQWMITWLSRRKSLSGEYRADPRLDVLDGVFCKNKYDMAPAIITSLKYSFSGSYKGTYTGRIYVDLLEPHAFYSGLSYLGGECL